ncbi:hemerythrin domain-containing protein [Bacillus methanolicus]|uniref:Hemerythrin HHE cation binding domain-containing protein n=1 Tax=Bacillus methanolicus (strain MGA3 / ATCC 53907) TaxID=796606 RepID=I3EBR6_BACMM|nr:hemerythrin domain-containing protein [Bacillus methanolicus]AIE61618.1 hemerythrin HHE cation binding domain-containing protein [Bacillus methanolicus MGA3]EIJ83937.1 Hemerythrin HHE cation binding domain protein [Bacillus methanolicus MGA3]
MEFSPCHMLQNGSVALCPALQQLVAEHGPLNEEKQALFDAAKQIGNNDEQSNWKEELLQLREKVTLFLSHLDPHSEREEGVLFPMMSKYIGNTTGPIAVMEYEHDQAKRNIAAFLEKTKMLDEEVNKEEAKELASYVINAYLILTEHFMKEENVLFPMAEQMLSDEEKEELAKHLM